MKKIGLTSYSILLYALLGIYTLDAKQSSPWHTKNPKKEYQEARLTITPSICVVKEVGEICQETITILFTSQKHRDICIYNANNTEPLWCDSDVKEVSLNVTVKANSSIKLFAKDKVSDEIIATNTFSLSTFQPVKKRARRHYGIGIL